MRMATHRAIAGQSTEYPCTVTTIAARLGSKWVNVFLVLDHLKYKCYLTYCILIEALMPIGSLLKLLMLQEGEGRQVNLTSRLSIDAVT